MPTLFGRAVVIAHSQQTRPLVAERLAHLWQRETHKSVRHSDIQFGTAANSPTCGRETRPLVAERNPQIGSSLRHSVRDSGADSAARLRHAATVFVKKILGLSGFPLHLISFRFSGPCPGKSTHLWQRETHTSVSVFLTHAQETVK